MLLAVDIGNTQTHLGVFDRDRLVHQWRTSTEASRTADELSLMFGGLLASAELSFTRQITGVSICSVVPSATQELRDMTLRYFGYPPLVVGPGVRTGIAVLTDNPREVGADRIANAAAAADLFRRSPVVVVDFGTAITVDALSGGGDYLGGAIAPGIDISAAALFSATALVQRVEVVAPCSAVGKSTAAAVQSGIVYGTASMVDGLVDRVAAELQAQAARRESSSHVEVVATGGWASTVVEHSRRISRIEPALTLTGLRLIFERNAGDVPA